jgi:hypothetical protein
LFLASTASSQTNLLLRQPIFVLFSIAFCVAVVLVVEIASQQQAIQLFSTVLVPVQEPIVAVPMGRNVFMLVDAALDPLYT